jgi:hypothetical protein
MNIMVSNNNFKLKIMKKGKGTTKGKIKCVTTKTIKGKRVTSTGETLPKGIYVSNNNPNNVTYMARPTINGTRVYLGSFKSIDRAKKAIKQANKA